MKKLSNSKMLMCLGLAIGCVSTTVLVISKNSSNVLEASNYSTNSVPKNINLNDTSASDIREYYSSLNSLSTSERQGTNLLKNLKPILKNGQKYFSYAGSATTAVWQAYEIVDRDWVKSPASEISGYNGSTGWITNYSYGTSNSNTGMNPYVHALYVNRDTENLTRAWGNHNQDQWGINQEHLWAKSNGFQSESPGTGARGDMMHLWAGNGRVNGDTHSNYFYGYVDTTKSYNDAGSYASTLSGNRRGTSRTLGGSQTVFEPQDADKGDIARAIFYMAARYNYLSGSDSDGIDSGNPNLEIVNALKTDTNSYDSTTTKTGKMGILQDLLEWNRMDPPDSWEIHRNNLLYNNFTNNRNPFIDFPEWAEYVWGKSVSGSYNSSPTGFATPNSNNINLFGNGGVNPNPGVVSVTVSPDSLGLDLNGTTTGNLTASVVVTDGASQTVNWTSSNTNVATVSSTGVVTAVAIGTCTITATSTADNTKSDTCSVAVVDSAGGQLGVPEDGIIYFGNTTGKTNIDQTSVTANDSLNNTWTITTTGTTSFTKNADYSQIGSNKNPASTITFETTFDDEKAVTALSISLGGFNGTQGDVSLEVGNNEIGAGSLNGSSDVTVNATDLTKRGTSVTIGISNIDKGVKVYNISYTYASVNHSSKELSSISLDTASVTKNFCVGDTFTSEGLITTAHYDDNSESVVTPASVSTPDMSTAGNKTVTVTYTEGGVTKTATYQITVSEPIVTSITATVDQTFHPGDMIITSDIYVEDNLGNEIVDFDFANEEYEFTYDDAPSGGGVAVKTFANAVSYGNLTCDVSVNVSRKAYKTVTTLLDTIDREFTGMISTQYHDWTKTATNSGIVYEGNSATTDGTVQLRTTNSNSGIVATANSNELNVLSVSLTWHSNNQENRKVDIYAKNTPYSAPTDLYDTSTQGTKIGTINLNVTDALEFSGSYLYIGLKSNYGAIYLDDITISYGNKQTAENVANYIMYADAEGQCENKFDFAKDYFEEMYIADKTEFMSSDDYVIASARTRFLAWARYHNTQITYLNGEYVFSKLNSLHNYSAENLFEDNSNSIFILLVVCTVGVGAVSIFYLLKKKKKSL